MAMHAKAHAMLERSCAFNSVIRVIAEDEIAYLSRRWMTDNFAYDHAVFESICPSNSAIRGRASAAIAANNG